MEEDNFIARFHQQVQKAREKAWYDRHIKQRNFKNGNLVLLYDSKFAKFPSKFKIHWLGPYVIRDISNDGAVQLAKLNGELFTRRVNGSRLKLYRDDSLGTAK